MPGTVVGSGKGNSIVSIGGNNYWLNSPLQFGQGEALMLKVAGLTPLVHFSLINRIRKNVGNSEVSTTSSSDKILQGLAGSDRNLNSSLTGLISLLHFGSNQPLPQPTLQLIESMRRQLLRSGGLTNPSLIRHSVLNGSLVTTGQDSGGKMPESGLQSLLQQIVDSLAMHRGAVGKLPVPGNYQRALGLSLYQSDDGDLLRSFTRNVEEQYLNLANSRNRHQDEMQQQPYRLFVELPVVFKDHIRSISIRFSDSKRGDSKDSSDNICSAEFELELQSAGHVYVRISIQGTEVTYRIGCENERVAIHLARCEKAIVEALEAYGLTLYSFHCEMSNGHLSPETTQSQIQEPGGLQHGIVLGERANPASTDESLRRRMREAHEQGKVPVLDEFELQIDSQTVPLDTEMPVELYCAMASLFVQLLEMEKP